MMGLPPADTGDRFSLVVGGPFHSVLRRLGMTDANHLPTQAAALILALAAWSLPALLVIVQSLADDHYSGWAFFSDWMAYTRYLIAIWIMIATERYANDRLITLVQHFRKAHIVSDADGPAFRSVLEIADRRSESALAELIILGVVLVWSALTAHYQVILSGTGWYGTVVGGESELSWAGEAARFFSTPLFLFLLLRWVWRFLVWTGLLYRISRLSLQLMPLHPDRTGGLGFLANFPGIFYGFVFALSCVIASAMIMELSIEQHALQTVLFALGGWLVLSVALVLGPMLVFARPLFNLREQALIEYGRLASHHHLAFHRKWIIENGKGEELMGSPDPSSASDLNATVEMVRQLNFIPVDLPAMLGLVVASGLPLLAVIVTQIPFVELMKWIFSTLF